VVVVMSGPMDLPATAAELLRLRRRQPPHWRGTAYHEAGHTVIAVIHRIRFDHAELHVSGGRVSVMVNTGMLAVAALLAGPIAQARATRRDIWKCLRTQLAPGGDTTHALALLGHDQARLAVAVTEAKQLVDRHWPEIEAVAAALLQRIRLTEAEVIEITSTARALGGEGPRS
jgi:hypothetical protein